MKTIFFQKKQLTIFAQQNNTTNELSLWKQNSAKHKNRMKYKRILLKLSGEALMGDRQYGIDPQRLAEYANEIKQIHDAGIEIAIVIGGGNIFRGVAGASNGMDRVQGDYQKIDKNFCW